MNEGLLKIAKSKFETVEEKKKQKSLLLKLKWGIANNPELGEEICDLMIDSIQARLSIIQEIENLDDENNENNNENEQNEYEDEWKRININYPYLFFKKFSNYYHLINWNVKFIHILNEKYILI